jgi:hypothetical protein
MSIPNIITINNNNYYYAKELYNYDKTFFYGCSKSIKTIIEKKNINEDMYIYASYNKKKGWSVSNNSTKLLLKEEWVINNIPKMNTNDEEVKYDIEEAPPVLELEEHEMFHDEGNILDLEITLLKKDLEIKDGIIDTLNMEIAKKDVEIAKKDVEIKNRDLIIENMKLKNLLNQNN